MSYPWAHPGWCPSSALRVALLLAVAAHVIGCARGSGSATGPPAVAVKIETARVVAVDDATEYVATLQVPRLGGDHAPGGGRA